jgi:hypothetical protein
LGGGITDGKLKSVTCTQDRNWSVKMKIVLEQAILMTLVVTIMAAMIAGMSVLTTILID